MKGETTAPRALSTSALGALVRRHDRDRYQIALFAPAEKREALFALYAFNYEIARVRESVTQPMLGQIRLQWWREVIDAAFTDVMPRAHAVAQPLTATIRSFALSHGHFDRMIDGREHDLEDVPPADMTALEDYADATSGALLHLVLEVLGARDAPISGTAREIGIAYGLAGLLRAMPFHARAGRCYIPADVAATTGLDREDYAALRGSPALRAAVAHIADTAHRELLAAKKHRTRVTRSILPALLPAVIADRFLTRLARAGYDPFALRLRQPDTLQVWRLAVAMLVRRF